MGGMRDGGDVADSLDGPRLLYHVHRGQTVGLLSLQTGERSVVSVRCPPAPEEPEDDHSDHSGHSGHGDDDRRGAGGTTATARGEGKGAGGGAGGDGGEGEGEGGSLCVVILEFPQSCYDQLVRTRPNVSLRTAWLTVSRLSPFFRTCGETWGGNVGTHTHSYYLHVFLGWLFAWGVCVCVWNDPPQH